ncbi:MAG TPA: hypothetical protein VFC00_06580 [Micromonosporaceae bacterium]|nr:hypothetical protein [Micromonosporaceae bacterium]
MDWLQALVTLAKAWSWPIVVLITVILFRKDLGELIGRIKHMKAPGFSFDFSEAVAATEELAQRIEPSPAAELPSQPAPQWSRTFLEAEAKRHATGAFILAWAMVENAAKQSGYIPTRESVEQFTRRLASEGVVPSLTPSLAHRLKALYNQVASGAVIPSLEDAQAFIDAAWRLTTTIRRVKTTEHGAWSTDH